MPSWNAIELPGPVEGPESAESLGSLEGLDFLEQLDRWLHSEQALMTEIGESIVPSSSPIDGLELEDRKPEYQAEAPEIVEMEVEKARAVPSDVIVAPGSYDVVQATHVNDIILSADGDDDVIVASSFGDVSEVSNDDDEEMLRCDEVIEEESGDEAMEAPSSESRVKRRRMMRVELENVSHSQLWGHIVRKNWRHLILAGRFVVIFV